MNTQLQECTLQNLVKPYFLIATNKFKLIKYFNTQYPQLTAPLLTLHFRRRALFVGVFSFVSDC